MKIKTIILFFLTLGLIYSCKENTKKEIELDSKKKEVVLTTKAVKKTYEDLKVLNFDELKPYLEKKDDKIHVVNFWATWCKPCVEELPAVERIYRERASNNVEVLLVSLDFPNEIESQLIPFIKNNGLEPEVVVLDDPNQNKWINGVDKSWSGAIPATIIYSKNKRSFFEKSFSYDELNTELQKFIN
ncbi:TlpA disulfide reductase family protein [Tenacibaculum sp. MEBiC06402]|uniref:TlpA disulfide reductase family protein n=1 Tax=unclassified Tenacibaculum TaxID=2635139 RepID=UPI003B9D1034